MVSVAAWPERYARLKGLLLPARYSCLSDIVSSTTSALPCYCLDHLGLPSAASDPCPYPPSARLPPSGISLTPRLQTWLPRLSRRLPSSDQCPASILAQTSRPLLLPRTIPSTKVQTRSLERTRTPSILPADLEHSPAQAPYTQSTLSPVRASHHTYNSSPQSNSLMPHPYHSPSAPSTPHLEPRALSTTRQKTSRSGYRRLARS